MCYGVAPSASMVAASVHKLQTRRDRSRTPENEFALLALLAFLTFLAFLAFLLSTGSALTGPALVAQRVARRPARDVAIARNAPTLPLSNSGRRGGHPPRRRVHSRGHKRPRHLDVRTQARAGALHPTLVAGTVALLAYWRDHAADPRHVHVPAHLGSVATTLKRAQPAPPASGVLGVADPRATLRQRVRAAVHVPGTDRFV